MANYVWLGAVIMENMFISGLNGIFFFNKIRNKKDYVKSLKDIMMIPGITGDK